MLAQPSLNGGLCSPLMQLAAANDEPALASCNRARPATTIGMTAKRARLIVFISLFSLCVADLSDLSRVPKTKRSRAPQTVSHKGSTSRRTLAVSVSISQRARHVLHEFEQTC